MRMGVIFLGFLLLAINFRISRSFLKKIENSQRFIRSADYKFFADLASTSYNEDNENNQIENDSKLCQEIASKNSYIWIQYNDSLKQWKKSEKSDFGLEVDKYFVNGTLDDLIEFLKINYWNLSFCPEIADVIVEKFGETRKIKITQSAVDFFLKNKMYRQLACYIHFQSIPFEYFRNHPINACISTFDLVFILNPEKIIEMFKPDFSEENFFLISSLVACNHQFPGFVFKILKSYIDYDKINNFDLIDQVCLGFLYTEDSINDSERFYLRNMKIISDLNLILAPLNDPKVLIALKTCQILNMIHRYSLMEDERDQLIISSIYVDESDENIVKLFLHIFNLSARVGINYFNFNFAKYQMKNEIDEYFKLENHDRSKYRL